MKKEPQPNLAEFVSDYRAFDASAEAGEIALAWLHQLGVKNPTPEQINHESAAIAYYLPW